MTLRVAEIGEILRDSGRRPYRVLVLYDRTGEIKALMWEEAGDLATCDRLVKGDVVKVVAKVDGEGSHTRLKVKAPLQKVVQVEDQARFERFTHKQIEDLMGEFEELKDEVRDPHLRRLLDELVDRLGGEIPMAPYDSDWPGRYWGSLLEMLVHVLNEARRKCEAYPELDHGLLTTALVFVLCGRLNAFDMALKDTAELSEDGKDIPFDFLPSKLLLECLAKVKVPAETSRELWHCVSAIAGPKAFADGFQSPEAEAVWLICGYERSFKQAIERHGKGRTRG
jgi:hypothetical protein